MRTSARLTIFAGAVVALGLLALAAPGAAKAELIVEGTFCGPLAIGWSCECTTSYGPDNVRCAVPGSGAGRIVITTCTSCPPPCSYPPCELQACRTRTSTSCQ